MTAHSPAHWRELDSDWVRLRRLNWHIRPLHIHVHIREELTLCSFLLCYCCRDGLYVSSVDALEIKGHCFSTVSI
jgi:hypothetical protein